MAVPHFYQSSPQTCGATCLRMLLAAMRQSYDEATIAQKCGTTSLGCTVHDLVQGAQSLGVNAALLALTDEPAAVAALSNQTPFVAMIDVSSLVSTMPLLSWHFVVPLALQQDEVEFHDPVDGPYRRVKLDDFLAAWATAAYRDARMDPVIRVRDFLRDNVGHLTRPGNPSFNIAAQRWFVPICLQTKRGDVVIGDIELDRDGHIIYAPSRKDLTLRADEVLANSTQQAAEPAVTPKE